MIDPERLVTFKRPASQKPQRFAHVHYGYGDGHIPAGEGWWDDERREWSKAGGPRGDWYDGTIAIKREPDWWYAAPKPDVSTARLAETLDRAARAIESALALGGLSHGGTIDALEDVLRDARSVLREALHDAATGSEPKPGDDHRSRGLEHHYPGNSERN